MLRHSRLSPSPPVDHSMSVDRLSAMCRSLVTARWMSFINNGCLVSGPSVTTITQETGCPESGVTSKMGVQNPVSKSELNARAPHPKNRYTELRSMYRDSGCPESGPESGAASGVSRIRRRKWVSGINSPHRANGCGQLRRPGNWHPELRMMIGTVGVLD